MDLHIIKSSLIYICRLLDELARLERNKERRYAREKAKGLGDGDASGVAGLSTGAGKPAGTQRRCANCGQIGHIKTNKKYVQPNFTVLNYFIVFFQIADVVLIAIF